MSYKKIRTKLLTTATAMTLASMLMTGCGANGNNAANSSSQEQTEAATEEGNTIEVVESSTIDTTDMFTERDLETDYDEENAVKITLADGASKVEGSGVTIDGDVITIAKEGTYVLSGELTNGQIVVSAKDTEKVEIVLNGVSIQNANSACIYLLPADKVFVTTAEGTENTLKVNGAFVAKDENNIDGAVFAKTDLCLKGEGTLAIEDAYGNGVVSKDDLKVTSGTYQITASGHGLEGKDSVRIANANITITADQDGLHSGNDEDESKGWIYIQSGNVTIKAGDDGIYADKEVRIDGGKVAVTDSYEGIEGQVINIVDGTVDVKASDDGVNAGGGSDTETTGTQKDKFAADENCVLSILGGTITVDADGDGVDSNGTINVSGGTIYISGPTNDGNGALDTGSEATITGGTVIAAGSSGMAVNFGSNSTQGTILVTLDETVSGEVKLLDANGTELAAYTPTKEYSSVVVSAAGVKDSGTYTLVTGDKETEVTMDGLVYGESKGMGGGPGGGHGGPRPEGMNGQPPEGMNGQPPEGMNGQPPEGMRGKKGEKPSENGQMTEGEKVEDQGQ